MTAPRITIGGPGWRTVRLDNGERIQIAALNPPWDVPQAVEWPMFSGNKYQIVEVDDVQRA